MAKIVNYIILLVLIAACLPSCHTREKSNGGCYLFRHRRCTRTVAKVTK